MLDSTCGSTQAAPGMHYHDSNGNALINEVLFPNLTSMVNLAHDLNLTAGWYHNNCICRDHCQHDFCELQIRQDAKATAAYGFDGVKLDGCGGQMNLSQWQYYLQLYSPPHKTIVIESCHWGQGPPPTRDEGGCPYHFYRTSGDIYPEYKSVVNNLQSVERYHSQNLSFPGCWAYPDMLQVGVHPHERAGLNPVETSHDVNDDAITDQIWNLISNREVLEINQVYVGDSGGVYWESEEMINLGPWDYPDGRELYDVVAPITQLLSKPLTKGRVAVLAMNHGKDLQVMTVRFETVPGVTCDPCQVRDVWTHQTIGTVSREITFDVGSHDSAFIVIDPAVGVSIRYDWSNVLFVPTVAWACLVLLWSLLRLRISRWSEALQAKCE